MLRVVPVDASIGRTLFRAGLQIDDDFAGNDDYQLNVGSSSHAALTEKGGEWRTLVGLGRVLSLGTDVYLPFAERGNWFVTPSIEYSALNQPLVSDGETVAQSIGSRPTAALSRSDGTSATALQLVDVVGAKSGASRSQMIGLPQARPS